jgi:hypothetical protein
MRHLLLAATGVLVLLAGALLGSRDAPTVSADTGASYGIADIKTFLETCPTNDPVYSQIRSDFTLRRNGMLVGALDCSEPVSSMPLSQYTDELIVVQTLRTIYYMDLGRSGHLPWTSGTLYAWMKSKINGIDIQDGLGLSYCCETYFGKTYIAVGAHNDFNRDFDRSWRGISANISLYAHETRHVDGFLHVSGCGVTLGCDQTYDETNLSPYGIQWWLDANWLSGNLYVGFSCLSPSEVQEIADWHLAGTNLYRSRFVDVKPPLLTMPAKPGGECRRFWGDGDCSGDIGPRDAQAVLKNVLVQDPLSQTQPCPAVGAQVTVDGVSRIWSDWDCSGDIGPRDAQAVLKNVLVQDPLIQTQPCPAVGSTVQVVG